MVLRRLFLSPFSFMQRERKEEQGTKILRESHFVIGLGQYLACFSLFLTALFPSHGMCYQIGARAISSSPFYQFSSGHITKNISVSSTVFPFLEIDIDYQGIEWQVYR